MLLALLFVACMLISGIAIRIAMVYAHRYGMVDRPGGHKLHDTVTPFVGGVGIYAVLIGTLVSVQAFQGVSVTEQLPGFLLGGTIIFLTGLADDIWRLHFKVRFLAQAVTALIMALWGAGTLLDLGGLWPGMSLQLGLLAIPFTIFATIGVINALNMIDGIDGLSGAVSFASLLLTACVAFVAGAQANLHLIIALLGGIAGFLYFNLRYPGNSRARVFLGDNGSMLLGFLFAWLFIDLSQGPQRAMTPVTALWLFAVPLMDTVCVMLRRLWLGKSPFRADRHHLHHLFQEAGFRVQSIVFIVAFIQLGMGGIGLLGLYLGVDESLMFGSFLFVFATYFYLIARPWRVVPGLRRLQTRVGLTSAQTQGLFIGHIPRREARRFVAALTDSLGPQRDYRLSLHAVDRGRGEPTVYAVIKMAKSGEEIAANRIRQAMHGIRERLGARHGLQVRQYLHRDGQNDRRKDLRPANADHRRHDRRRPDTSTMIYATESAAGSRGSLAVPA